MLEGHILRLSQNFGRPPILASQIGRLYNRKYSTVKANVNNKLRNIGIIAHIDAGKTTTTERMLYYSGLTNHIGDVDQGDTVMDYLPTERDRGITINSAAITFSWNDHKINLIDTPGHADFTFEVIRSIRVLDGAVTIFDAVAGVEAQTEKVWKQAGDIGIPRIAYVNKMDREGAGFGRTVREIVSKLGTRIALVNVPYFENNQSERTFSGVVDVIEKKAIKWKEGSDGKAVDVIELADLDPAIQQDAVNARTALIETLSEVDDQIVEEFLDSSGDYMEFSSKSIRSALRRATLAKDIVPVLCGASFKNIGVQPLLESIVNYLPSPADRPPAKAAFSIGPSGGSRGNRKKASASKKTSESTVQETSISSNSNLTCALAFKVSYDPIRGMLVYVRVYSGTLRQGSVIYNTTTGKRERVVNLVQMQADRMIDVPSVETGNIGVIVGSQEINTGDTIVAHISRKDGISSLPQTQLNLKLQPIEVPPPVFLAAIEPNSVSDEKGMNEALTVLLREDPSFKRTFDEDSQQTLLGGMGELHLEIAYERLKQLKAKVTMGKIMVSYRETISRPTMTITKEILSDSTGEISNARVSLSVIPVLEEEIDDSLTLLQSDNNYVRHPDSLQNHPLISEESILDAIEVGAVPTFARGGELARLPLRSLAVDVGEVWLSPDSTSASAVSTAVRLAAAEALDGLQSTDYSIMEPLMNVTVVVQDEDVGNVVKDISSNRKGYITSLGEDDSGEVGQPGLEINYKELSARIFVPTDYTMYLSKHAARTTSRQSILKASIPLRKMTGYLTSLRSLTQGRGNFIMGFDRYEVAGSDVSSKIISSL